MSNTVTSVTPFIRPIAQKGGTFYTFTSAGEDFTLSLNSDDTKGFRFSKFALLRIPDFSDSSEKMDENLVRLMAIPGANKSIRERNQSFINVNNYFAESFQNYCLNLETGLLSDSSYDHTKPQTVSERVFFKWLKEMGAIRFTNAKEATNISPAVFAEEEDSSLYKRVVKYIGEIDITNNYKGLSNYYNEVYVHIPTEAGSFPQVYFDTLEDDNYFPGMSICRNNDDLNDPYIFGRKYDTYHPIGNFDTKAYYDNMFGGNYQANLGELQLRKLKTNITRPTTINDFDEDQWWFLNTSNRYCYYTQHTNFTDPTNEYYAIGLKGSSAQFDDDLSTWTVFKRSKLDGIKINFNPTAYAGIDDNIYSLLDVAKSRGSQDFDFNCILIYYDVLEKTPITSDIEEFYGDIVPTPLTDEDFENNTMYNTNVLATNLFGVLFLDNVEISLGAGSTDNTINTLGVARIPSLTKCIPNKETKLNGNAYGFKLNIKLDVSNINAGIDVETYISDSKTFSLDVFADALNNMRKTSELVSNYFFNNISIDQRLRGLEESSNLSTARSYSVLKERLDSIESYLTQKEIFLDLAEKKEVIDLINQNYAILNNLLRNNTSITVGFDLGTIKEGPGIKIERDPNSIEIKLNEAEYNFGDKWKIYPPETPGFLTDSWIYNDRNDINNRNYYSYEIPLKPMRNYIRIVNESGFIPTGDFYLYIKDSLNSWQKGQSMRIYFQDPYPLINGNNFYNFYIKTEFGNEYKTTILKLNAQEFRDKGNKPIIDIHCINPLTMEFIVDFLN